MVDDFDYEQQDTVVEDNNDEPKERRDYASEAFKSRLIQNPK